MKQIDLLGILPAQFIGKEIETGASIDLKNEKEAKLYYEAAKARLLSVNSWHFLAGIVSGHFQLMNDHGQKIDRHVKFGDYIRIDIPGPGSTEGDGYDWVHVEEKKEAKEGHVQCIGFRVRPSKNPTSEKNETAHFYKKDATSNFFVTRDGNTVTALIIDRNLEPNNESASIIDEIRHVAVSLGAIGAFSKAQWKNLAEGIVKKI